MNTDPYYMTAEQEAIAQVETLTARVAELEAALKSARFALQYAVGPNLSGDAGDSVREAIAAARAALAKK